MNLRAAIFATLFVCAVVPAARAADEPLVDVLDLDATVTAEVVPDLAIVTMAIVREGPDVPALTADVNRVLAKALADAKAVPGVVASNAGYSTTPRFDNRNGAATRNGWEVHAQIVVKSKDLDALGGLVGRLAQSLQIAGSTFDVSPELRAAMTSALIDQGARAFQDRASATAKAFGYAGYAIREVHVSSAGSSGPRPMYRAVAAPMSSAVAPLPIEAGVVTLTLTVNGSVRMRH